MKRHDWLTVALLWLLTLGLAALFAWRTPRWQAPDEPAHYAYVQTVAESGRPPVLLPRCYDETYKNGLIASNFATEPDLARFCYEGHQPPLFYYLAAPVYHLSGGALLALRLLCALLGAFVPPVAWAIVRGAGGDRGLALATALLVALLPQHLAMLGALNNDALSFLLVALALWQMVTLVQGAAAGRGAWLRLGLLVALCLLTKTLAWVVLPLTLLTALLPRVVQGRAEPGALRHAALALALALLVVLPWFARNVATYGGGDVMGLVQHDEVAVGQPRTEAEVARRGLVGTLANGVQTTFHSFWGQFGWMKAPLQAREYALLLGFSAAAALGLAGWLRRRGWRRWGLSAPALLLCAAWAALNGALLLYYNLEFVQYQGRYLFHSLSALALFAMIGLGAWLPPRARWLPWGALLCFLAYLDALALWQRLPGMMSY